MITGIKKLTATKKNIYQIILIFNSIILLRIIPHIANCVPIFTLLTLLSLTCRITKKQLIVLTLTTILISDLLLHIIYNYSIFASCSIFTYSGFALVVLLSLPLVNRQAFLLGNCIIATVIFWLWTNFGVWLVDGVYSLDLAGFVLCYSLAIPFLKYSLLANILGSLAFIILYQNNKKLLSSLNTSKCDSIHNIIY